MKQLLARAHGCEFGWEICTVAPAYRHIAKKYDEVIIVCKPSHRYLYQDFATKFEDYDKEGRSGLYGWFFRDKAIGMPKQFTDKYPDADILCPSKRICTKAIREYKKYGTFDMASKYDIVIHARSEVKFGRTNRNWSDYKFWKLIKHIRKTKNVSVCCIGTKGGAYYIKGTEDRRGISIEELCNIFASSNICIGVSSGPIHLASLCGCTHMVWTDNKYQKAIKGTNRDRYERLWNPFKTACVVIDREGWKPHLETVEKEVMKFL